MLSFRTIGLVAVLVALGVAAALLLPGPAAESSCDSSSGEGDGTSEFPGAASSDYASVLAQTDREIRALAEQVAASPSDSMRAESLAAAWLDRARLTGDFADYQQAEAVLERAFQIAGEGAGPLGSRMRLNYSLRRFEQVRADLELAKALGQQTPAMVEAIASTEASLLLVSGDGPGGLEALVTIAGRSPSTATLGAAAIAHWKLGNFDEAEVAMTAAADGYDGNSPITPAWIHLHLGLFDFERGRLEEALVHYRAADAELSGWWLIDEHIAEALLESGQEDEALRIYEDVVERSGHPEFMDAIARILRRRGDQDGARRWADRARQEYDARLLIFPEATRGHAAEHWASFSTPEEALELARANAENAPNGDALTSLVNALLRAQLDEEAAVVADRALATGYSSAELHSAAGSALNSVGREAEAADQFSSASAIDPRLQEF